jgi:tetratricopeptide (TPR) repeat protein
MKLSLALVSCLLVAGCGGRVATSPTSTPADVAHADATERSCREVAMRSEALGTPSALRDAGVAYARCGLVDDGIRVLERAVVEGKFQDAPALVALANLQMVKSGPTAEAKLNVQRALAIDDNSMTAYDQLAQWYVRARRLDLAALVCSQAITRNASWAPIHVTLGVVENESGRVNAALAEFALARRLDPSLFDAHLNYALVNLGFRGFEQAREALEQALRLRPNDYDAHLAMALALRGLMTDAADERIEAVQAELDAAKKIDPKRPDAYFNEAILMHEYRARSQANAGDTKEMLRKAERAFEAFVGMASGNPRYDVAVKRARTRIEDIEATIQFL